MRMQNLSLVQINYFVTSCLNNLKLTRVVCIRCTMNTVDTCCICNREYELALIRMEDIEAIVAFDN